MRVQLRGWCWFLCSLFLCSLSLGRRGVTWALFHDEGQVLNLRDKFQILRIKDAKISAWSLHTQNRYKVRSSGGFLQVLQTGPYLSFWNLRNLDSTLNLGRCRLFIRTVPTQFSKIIIQLNQRLHVQCNLSRGTPALWQAIHVFLPLPSSYRCLKEISPVLTDNFTYSPVNRPKPILHVLTNPRFRPRQGLEKGRHPRRITRWNANCSEWHALQ